MIPGKIFLMFVILTFVFVNCSNDKREIPVHSLADVLANLAPASKAFEIDPTEETLLNGDKGTVVYIPGDAFQFEDGTSPTGAISIEIKECYSLADMIAENLHTTSGPRILETAGMIYLNATANGKRLSIKDGKAVVVGFPKGDQSKEMDLFYDFALNDTASTWVPDYRMYEAEAMKTAQADSTAGEGYDAITIKYPIEMTDDLFDYGFGFSGGTGTFFELPLAGQNRTILDYIDDPTTIADSIARKFVKNGWRVHYQLNIDKNGKMTNLIVENDDYTKHNAFALKVVKDYFENAPAFDLSIDSIKVDHDRTYSLGITGSKRLNQERFKKKFRAQYSQYTTQAIQKMDKDELEYYLFSATNMGWINCDRFWNIDEEKKTNFVVTTPGSQDTKVQIVFKDINSLMTGTYQGGQYVFNNVPLGRQIKVIGISYANGKPTLGAAETTIGKAGFELTAFKEFSLDDLEKELK
jgi:hypothetical protein